MARRLGALLAVTLALGVAGCGEGEGIVRGGTIIGETLTVYSVLPQPARGEARDVVDGERLALQQAGGRAGAFKVNFASLDSTGGGETGDELPGQVASAVRQAIADAQVIAVIGDREAETALISVPLLNSAGILHVSPALTDRRFTEGGGPGEPERFYPAGERTFFPVFPPDYEQRSDEAAFARAFRTAFRRPATGAAREGHAAMRAVLDAIARAGDRASSRQVVIDAFRASAPD